MEKTPRPSDERAYIRNLVRQLLVESSDVAKADDFTIVKRPSKMPMPTGGPSWIATAKQSGTHFGDIYSFM